MIRQSTVQTRRLVLAELAACFYSQRQLTKQQLINYVKTVNLDASWFKYLKQAKILNSSRGVYSLNLSVDELINRKEYYATYEPSKGFTRVTTRPATMQDLLNEIKRLKGGKQ